MFGRNQHNTVKQLSFNLKQIFKIKLRIKKGRIREVKPFAHSHTANKKQTGNSQLFLAPRTLKSHPWGLRGAISKKKQGKEFLGLKPRPKSGLLFVAYRHSMNV